ncbi:winged helix-turn-helix transcriptional regulator [Microbulbifer epialgicus]|uniref:Winged helix-turn-helix transcriptional regulator n=1 Tax=Microbulbifer epialgicus TaxID=393907 RepID=A0ABV4P660_9GAMM
MTVSSIAAHVNLSRSSVTERIKRLEGLGIIRGYQVLLVVHAESNVTNGELSV